MEKGAKTPSKRENRSLVYLLKRTLAEFGEIKTSRLAAALAYYAVFSLSPLLLLGISIAGLVFGEEAAQGRVVGQIEGTVGSEAAELIQTMLAASRDETSGTISIVIGLATLLFGASALFGHLQDALNTIWKVKPPVGAGIKTVIKKRLISFAMVVLVGLLIILSLLLTTGLSVLNDLFARLPLASVYLFHLINLLFTFGLITLLFAILFKFLPDVKIEWRDVWLGSAFTSVLFLLGTYLISFYLGRAGPGSVYGAAGSLVILLLWIYYLAQIFFFGSQLIYVYNSLSQNLSNSDNSK
jgi:membrane protein